MLNPDSWDFVAIFVENFCQYKVEEEFTACNVMSDSSHTYVGYKHHACSACIEHVEVLSPTNCKIISFLCYTWFHSSLSQQTEA